MTLAERITKAREAAGLSKSDLARACGVSPSAVAQWETGETKTLEGENLVNAATALRVDAMWLATGKGEENPRPMMIGEPSSKSVYRTSTAHGESLELDTYAGEKVEDFYVHFSAGVVRRVRVHLDSSAFIVVTTALTEKYGPPDSREASVVQNRMGAKFDQEELVWKHSGDRIEAKRRSSTLTQMEVQLFNEADLAREVDELKSKAKGAAKDL